MLCALYFSLSKLDLTTMEPVYIYFFGLNALLKFYKLAILVLLFSKWHIWPPKFQPLCKTMTPFDFDSVKADMSRFFLPRWILLKLKCCQHLLLELKLKEKYINGVLSRVTHSIPE